MTDITAAATENGTILLTVTTDGGQQRGADLTIDDADKLKTQIDSAILAARLRHMAQINPTVTSAFAARLSLAADGSPRGESPHTNARRGKRRVRRYHLWAFLRRT